MGFDGRWSRTVLKLKERKKKKALRFLYEEAHKSLVKEKISLSPRELILRGKKVVGGESTFI